MPLLKRVSSFVKSPSPTHPSGSESDSEFCEGHALTFPEAQSLVRTHLQSLGLHSSVGLRDDGHGGAHIGACQVYYDYDWQHDQLKCSALIYHFRHTPEPQVVKGFRDQSNSLATNGASLDYEPDNHGLYLSKNFSEVINPSGFKKEMNTFLKTAQTWTDEGPQRVAEQMTKTRTATQSPAPNRDSSPSPSAAQHHHYLHLPILHGLHLGGHDKSSGDRTRSPTPELVSVSSGTVARNAVGAVPSSSLPDFSHRQQQQQQQQQQHHHHQQHNSPLALGSTQSLPDAPSITSSTGLAAQPDAADPFLRQASPIRQPVPVRQARSALAVPSASGTKTKHAVHSPSPDVGRFDLSAQDAASLPPHAGASPHPVSPFQPVRPVAVSRSSSQVLRPSSAAGGTRPEDLNNRTTVQRIQVFSAAGPEKSSGEDTSDSSSNELSRPPIESVPPRPAVPGPTQVLKPALTSRTSTSTSTPPTSSSRTHSPNRSKTASPALGGSASGELRHDTNFASKASHALHKLLHPLSDEPPPATGEHDGQHHEREKKEEKDERPTHPHPLFKLDLHDARPSGMPLKIYSSSNASRAQWEHA